jgi:hypothetical protein
MGISLLKMGNIKDAVLRFEKVANLNSNNRDDQKGLKESLDIMKKNNLRSVIISQ